MSNDLFFGRESQIKWLNDQIFTLNPVKGYSCSLRGPNGIGKTYLKNHLLADFKDKIKASGNHTVFIVDTSMENVSYHRFFLDIFKKAAKQLNETILNASPYYDEETVEELLTYIEMLKTITSIGEREEEFINDMTSEFFTLTSNLGLYFILIIDEFDNARVAFPEDTDSGLIFNKLFKLSAKTGTIRFLSVILISRRRAGTIAHHMSSGSNFDDAYPAEETTLKGFNDEEMEQYYNSYSDLDCGLLPKVVKDTIAFYCGRHPDLLMRIREHIQVHCKTIDSINIAQYYTRNGSSIRNAYSRMLDLLCNEYVDRRNHIPAIDSFKQAFNIVPAYDANLDSQIALLSDFGLIVQSDNPEKNSSTDITPDSVRSEKIISFQYEPIMECFLYYVKSNSPIMEKNEVNQLIDATEAKFRLFLQKHLLRIYGSEWQEQIDLSSFNKEDYWENLNKDAERFGAFDRKITLSVLDVLAFFNLGLIVKQNWDEMKDYLPSFKSKNELYNACFSLTKYRNCCYHGTLKILGNEQIKELKEICKKLLGDFEKVDSNDVQKVESRIIVATTPQTTAPSQSSLTGIQLEERNRLVGTICIFTCNERKSRGNLVGVLDNGLPASISPKDALTITDPDPIGKSFNVRIIQWDNGPTSQKYNVVPVEP